MSSEDDGISIYALGDEPEGNHLGEHPSLSNSRGQSAISFWQPANDHSVAAQSCPVCRNLTPSAPMPGTASAMDVTKLGLNLGLVPPADHYTLISTSFGPDMSLYHDVNFIKDYTPPWPQASKWIKSAMAGCQGCQLVVEAASSFAPFWFDDFGSRKNAVEEDKFPNKFLIAISLYSTDALHVWLVDTTETQFHRRNICLEVFTKPGDPKCFPTVSVGGVAPVASRRGDPQSLQTINKWLKDCTATHHACQKPLPEFRPTRLIEMMENQASSSGIRARLVKGASVSDKYVALSYCWGSISDSKFLKTLKTNIQQHFQDIAVDLMPTGIRDVMRLTLDLGMKYIWVDAICIIQDDDIDWKDEAESMAQVYSNADLVIANNVEPKCDKTIIGNTAFGSSFFQCIFTPPAGGNDYIPVFLKPKRSVAENGVRDEAKKRSPYHSEQAMPEYLTPPNHECQKPQAYARISPEVAHAMVAGAKHIKPLHARGWVYQEEHLAFRWLELGCLEMKWKCLGAERCECGHISFRKFGTMTYREKYTPKGVFLSNFELGGQRDSNCVGMLLDPTFPLTTIRSLITPAMYMGLLAAYSGRVLTMPRDALIAFSGVIKAIQNALRRTSNGEDEWGMLNGVPGFRAGQSQTRHDLAVEFLLWRREKDDVAPGSVSMRNVDWPFTPRAYTLPRYHAHFAVWLNNYVYRTWGDGFDIKTVAEDVAIWRTLTGDPYLFATNQPQKTVFPSFHFIGRCGRQKGGRFSHNFSFVKLDAIRFRDCVYKGFFPSVEVGDMQMDDISNLDMESLRFNEESQRLKGHHDGRSVENIGHYIPGGAPVSGHITLTGPLLPLRLRTSTTMKKKLSPLPSNFSLQTVLRGALELELNHTVHWAITPDDELLEFIPDSRHVAFGALDEMRATFPCTSRVVESVDEMARSPSGFRQFEEEERKSKFISSLWSVLGRHKLAGWPGFSDLGPEEKYRLDEAKGNVADMFPCAQGISMPLKRLCRDASCRCRRGWTNMGDYPAFALKMGLYIIENWHGKRNNIIVYLILTWNEAGDPERRGRFTRIGLGYVTLQPGQEGYIDPFRCAERETITII